MTFIDGIQYKPDGTIDIIETEEGVARNNAGGSYSYEYNLSDHLGNVRYTFNRNPVTGQLAKIQADDYFAFGLRKAVNPGVNKYLYNGKELQEELGQLDYGARFYDPEIVRFNTIDPMSEVSRRWSTYSYAMNNPIRFIDVDGMYSGDAFNQMGSFGSMAVEDYSNTIQNASEGFRNDVIYDSKGKLVQIIINNLPDRFFQIGNGGVLTQLKSSQLTSNMVTQYAQSMADYKNGGTLNEVKITGQRVNSLSALPLATPWAVSERGLEMSFPIERLFPTLRAVNSFVSILDLIGNSRIKLAHKYSGLTGSQIIAKFKKVSVREQFPEEYNDVTWENIEKDANKGIKAARTARKLLNDNRFNK